MCIRDRYYFSFSDCSDRYTLVVYGEAEQISELQQSFIRVFPIILLLVLAIALVISWLYSRMITKPVLEISRISEKMSDLQLDWMVDEQRTDELGTLGKSLNRLSRNLSTALSDLQNANRKLEADIEHEKELEQARTNFFSAVSHELKTPVTIIKGQLEGMLPGFLTAISRKLMNRAILVLSPGADANIYVCTRNGYQTSLRRCQTISYPSASAASR